MKDCLVILQCDSGHLNGELIACARHRIYDLRAKAEENQTTHVLFIIHIPRQIPCSLIGYQGEPWISAHIDDLKPSEEGMIELSEAIRGVQMSELFIGGKWNIDKSSIPYSTQTSDNTSAAIEERVDVEMETNSLIYTPHNIDLQNISSNHCAQTIDVTMKDGILSESMDLSVEDIEDMSCDDENQEIAEGERTWAVQPSLLPFQPQVQKIPLSSAIESEEQIKKVDNVFSETMIASQVSEDDQITNQVFQVKKNPLFKRLFRYIQPAASKLQDFIFKRSTKRVELLVDLIPKSIQFDPGKYSHLFNLL